VSQAAGELLQPTIDKESSTTSRDLFARAERVLPGGVNSPVRAFRAVGGVPRFIARGSGARVWDVDGVEYIDCIGSWGPLILGHSHPAVVGAIAGQAARGAAFGAPTELEVEMAELVTRVVPSIEMVRMVNSGTEATMAAVRLARGATGRSRLVKFEGCYHGHGDSFLVKAGSGAATFGTPDSPGVPAAVARETIAVPYNDLDALRRAFDAHPRGIAAVIVEPIVGNMGVVRPLPGFLEGVRALCNDAGTILIFDEVMTGFRVARGGAQELTGIRADLTTLGKVIGGGLPVGAYGGRRDLMEQVSPAGPVYQAGTMSGNPIAMAAGLATLRTIDADAGFYDRLEALGAQLEDGLRAAIQRHAAPCQVARAGSMWTLFFTDRRVERWSDAASADTQRFARFFQEMIGRRVLIAPSQFEANFVSAAHTSGDIAAIAGAADESLGAALA
jgi:glutamate-1-semialdehyde 2,1-aminomutase